MFLKFSNVVSGNCGVFIFCILGFVKFWILAVWIFGIWVFGIWVFGIWVFGTWVFGIWIFGSWVFGIWVVGGLLGTFHKSESCAFPQQQKAAGALLVRTKTVGTQLGRQML